MLHLHNGAQQQQTRHVLPEGIPCFYRFILCVVDCGEINSTDF